ncbi:hypothetical protein [Marinomonas atlantica]|uniref:hypothetical protein n=1 Tax=Marinomonas atlantica TaxID=1806668 RepID=UPI00082BD3DE|nr:hypothetical protein [Marinomonas atlantica]
MSGGGDNSIEETPEQKELARIAIEKWNFSQDTLAPLTDQYMAETDRMRSDPALAYQRGRSNETSQVQNANARNQLNQVTQQMGLNPNSGKAMMMNFQGAASNADAAGDFMARSQNEQLNQHVIGLQNINAIGMGESAEAQSGIGDIAQIGAQEQRSNAQNTFNRRSANYQLLGNIAGAATSYGMSAPSTSSIDTAAPISYNTPTASGFTDYRTNQSFGIA